MIRLSSFRSLILMSILTLGGARAAAAASTPVATEGEPGGSFAPAAAVGSSFGLPGQLVLSMGATTDEHLFFHKQSGGGWQLQLSPALDYFLIQRLSVGGVLGYRYTSGGAGTGTNASGATRILVGGRVGFNIDINDRFSFWPLAGLFLERTSANHASTTNTWFGLFAPVLFHVAPHFFAGLGPSFELNLSGPNGNQYGIDSIIGGWF